MGTGAAVFSISDDQSVTEVSLSFRTSQLAAVLLHMASPYEEGSPLMVIKDKTRFVSQVNSVHVLCFADVLCRLTS